MKLFPSADIEAELHGIVTSSVVKNRYAYFHIHDGTGSIQVAASVPPLSEQHLEACKLIRQYDRLHLNGKVTRFTNKRTSQTTPTVSLAGAPAVIPARPGRASLDQELIESNVGDVGGQIFLARVRERATTFFQHQKYLDLETRSISSVWQEEGVRPLRIDYPGYGIPAYLIPSPRTQLLKAIILTGRSKVFSVARCFTPTYRDPLVSAESPFLCAQYLGATLDDLVHLSEDAVRFILQDISTAPVQSEMLTRDWPRVECVWPPDLQAFQVVTPEIHVYCEFCGDHSPPPHIQSIFRLCWPQNVVLAEGVIETLQNDVNIGTVSIHFERLVAVIRMTRRQMQDLRQTQWINW